MRTELRDPVRAVSVAFLAVAAVWLGQACTTTEVTGVTIATVTVSPASATLLVGESRLFSAEVRDDEGAVVPSSLVTWSSGNEGMASVGSDGRATALRAGTVEVRASAQGVTGTATLTIQPGPDIRASTQSVSFFALRQGSDPDAVQVSIDNGGNGVLDGLSASTTYAGGEPGGWVRLALSSTEAPATLEISASIGSLPAGVYHATVTVRSTVAEDVPIQVELTVAEDRPILSLSPTAVGFAGVAGSQPPASQAVQVTNAGGGELSGLTATVAYNGDGGWLTADLSSTQAPSVLTLRADPTLLAPGSYQATVQVASSVATDGTGTVNVNFAVDAEPLANLSVVKDGPPLATQGDTVPFAITVYNDGPRDAVSVVLVDSLPEGLGFVRASGGGVEAAGVVTWSGGIVPAGGSVADTVWTSADSLGAVTNVASVSSVTKDPSPGDQRAVAPVTVLAKPADLAVTKTGPATALVGAEVTYRIDVAHVGGPVDALDVLVRDVLPPELTFVSATGGGTYSAPTRTVTWSLGDIPVGGGTGFTLTARIGDVASVAITNVATVSATTRDPDGTNDQATHVLAASREADLAISKTGPASAAAGERITYGIAVDHVGGSSSATDVVVEDELPAALTFVSATAGGAYDASSRTVTWDLGDVAVGGSRAMELTVDIGPSAAGTVNNTAVVSTTATDAVTGNNSSGASTTVTRIADVAVSKTGPASVPPGTEITYSVSVAHVGGPSDASGVVVTDTLPAGLTFASATGGWSYDAPSRTVTWTVEDLPVGGSVPLSVTALGPSVTGTIVNTAGATSTSTDPDPGNDTNSATTTIAPAADLALSKSAPATAVAGNQITYGITVKHVGGTADATDVVVTDPLPSGVTFVSAGSGTLSGGTVTWSLGGIEVGDSAKASLTVRADAGTVGLVSNTATVTASSADPTPGNDSGTASTTVSQIADLSIAKTGPASVPQGSNITYTITVTNTSATSGASGIVVTDPLPSEVTFVSATDGGSLDLGEVTWSLGSLGPGESRAVGLTVRAGSGGAASTTVTNTASVSSTSSDPQDSNDVSSFVTTVTPTTDLSLTMTAPDTAIVAGLDFAYTIVVRNLSSTVPANGITLTDVLPTGLTGVAADHGGTYDPDTRTVTWTVDALGLLGVFTRVLTVTVDPDVTGTISNTATVASSTGDSDLSNNSSTTVISTRREADLSIAMSGDPTATAGDNVTYKIDVTNTGPSDANGITITDALPTELAFVSATEGGMPGGGGVTWTVTNLAAGATASVEVTATIAADVTGDVTNTASVAATSTDPDAGNDEASATTTVSPPPPPPVPDDGFLEARRPETRPPEAIGASSVYATSMKEQTSLTEAQPTRGNEDRSDVLRAENADPR